MKIALITENVSPGRGGAERSVMEMAECLVKRGHAVTIVGARASDAGEGGEDESTVAVEMLKVHGAGRSGWWRGFKRAVAEHLASCDYDVVHSMVPLMGVDVYQPRGGSILHSALRQAESYEKPWKVAFKRATLGFNRGRQLRIAAERELATADNGPVIAALSEYVQKQFADIYGVKADRMRLIRNGVSLGRLRDDEAREKGTQLRQQYDPDGDKAVFLFAAENFQLKGLSPLIRAVSLAAERRGDGLRDFCVLVAGSTEYRDWWQQVRKCGQDNRILFLGRTSEMAALYHMCDAVVLPTFNDACSRVVMESLAVGTPALTTANNGAEQFFSDKKHGIILASRYHVDDLAAGLLRLCDAGHQAAMSDAIEADRLYEQVSMDRHVDELVELYESLGKRA